MTCEKALIEMEGPVNCSPSELSTYLQALAAGFLPTSCLDTNPCARSSGLPIASKSYRHGKKTVAFPGFPSLVMSSSLTENHGAALLTWYLAGSPAKTSALQAKAQASTANDQACGPTWRGSLARFDRDSLSWKTVQLCLLGDSELSSVIWPRSGMTADGQCWELPMLGRTTSGTGSGLWQTPVADDAVNRVKGKINSRGEPKLSAQVIRWPTPLANSHTGEPTGGQLNPMFVEWLQGFPLAWTELKPLEMPKCRSALQPHGECLAA